MHISDLRTGYTDYMLAENIDTDIRQPDVIECSIVRLPLYENLNTKKIDTNLFGYPANCNNDFLEDSIEVTKHRRAA